MVSPFYGTTASGLQCSWGSKLDETVPRAKKPSRALPPELREKLGFGKSTSSSDKQYFEPNGGIVRKQKWPIIMRRDLYLFILVFDDHVADRF